MKHFVGRTQNNLPVYVDLFQSEAAKHISRQPYLLTLAAEALRRTTLDKLVVDLEYDMGRVIGYDFVVKTTDADTVFYVQLVHDSIYTRFIKNGKPLPTQYVSIVLQRAEKDTHYSLQDIWIGSHTPPRPGSDTETAESNAYWEDHAFVFENQPVQLRTLTKTRPY